MTIFASVTPLLVLAETLPEPYATFAQYGLAGVLGYLLLRRLEAELTRANARSDKAEAQRDALTEKVFGEIVPLLGEVSKVMTKVIEQTERDRNTS